MSGYNNTRSVFAGLVLGSVLLTGFWAWSADYPPQGGGSAFLGNLSGNDLTLASGDEIVWNADTFVGRSAAGTAYVGATTGTADGTLRVDQIKDSDNYPLIGVAVDSAGEVSIGRASGGIRFANETTNTSLGRVSTVGLGIRSNMPYCWSSSATNGSATADTFLERGAAGTVDVNASAGGGGDGTLGAATVAISAASSTTARLWGPQSSWLGIDDGAGGAANVSIDGNLYIGTDATGSATSVFSVLPGALKVTVTDDSRLVFGSGTDMFVQGELTTLVNNTASTVFSVVMGNGDMAGLVIDYTVQATDTTEYQSECGTVRIAIVDDAGGVVASTPGESSVQALSSGTLTTAWTVVTTDDQSIEVQLNANTSLTPTTLQVRWKATFSGDVALTVP